MCSYRQRTLFGVHYLLDGENLLDRFAVSKILPSKDYCWLIAWKSLIWWAQTYLNDGRQNLDRSALSLNLLSFV